MSNYQPRAIPSQNRIHLAGFWLRFFAYLADLSILMVCSAFVDPGFIAKLLTAILNVNALGVWAGVYAPFVSMIAALVLQFGASFLYFPLFESSKWGATPGKLLFRISVRDESGAPVTLPRAFFRNLSRLAPFAPIVLGIALAVISGLLHLGGTSASVVVLGAGLTFIGLVVQYPMAAFTARKQALHDLLAHTLVARSGDLAGGECILKAICSVLFYLFTVSAFGLKVPMNLGASPVVSVQQHGKPRSAPGAIAESELNAEVVFAETGAGRSMTVSYDRGNRGLVPGMSVKEEVMKVLSLHTARARAEGVKRILIAPTTGGKPAGTFKFVNRAEGVWMEEMK